MAVKPLYTTYLWTSQSKRKTRYQKAYLAVTEWTTARKPFIVCNACRHAACKIITYLIMDATLSANAKACKINSERLEEYERDEMLWLRLFSIQIIINVWYWENIFSNFTVLSYRHFKILIWKSYFNGILNYFFKLELNFLRSFKLIAPNAFAHCAIIAGTGSVEDAAVITVIAPIDNKTFFIFTLRLMMNSFTVDIMSYCHNNTKHRTVNIMGQFYVFIDIKPI